MAGGREELRDEYAAKIASGEVVAWLEPPVYCPLVIPGGQYGTHVEGPHEDVRGTQIVRTEDVRLPRWGVEVGTPDVKFLFLPPHPETPDPVEFGA